MKPLPPFQVIYQTAEDGLGDTVKPRLIEAEADLDRVLVIDEAKRVFNSIDFSKSMHYNPLAYIKTESDVLKFVTALIANTKGDGKEGDEFWTKAETLLYCALVAYIVFEGPEEERNMNTLVEMINSMEVREDDETFKNAVDYSNNVGFRRNLEHFGVKLSGHQ